MSKAALILKREMPPTDARFLAMLSEGRLGEALSTDLKAVRAQQQELNRTRQSQLFAVGHECADRCGITRES
jgi:hypothetical protein